MIAYNHKHKKKSKIKWYFRSIPFKEQAFFADVKHNVVKTHLWHTITAPKVMVIFTQVQAYLLSLKAFEFVSFYTQKVKLSS